MIGPDPDTRYIYFWNPHKKHYRSALGIVSRSADPAKRWTRVGAALISQLADIERGRDESGSAEAWSRQSVPMLDLIPWDVGAKALAANASVESQATSGPVYATRLRVRRSPPGSAQPTLHLGRDSSRQGWMPTKPDPMSIRTDTLMAQLQTRRQVLTHDRLTSIVSTSGGSTAVRPLNCSSCARAGCMQLAGVRFFYF